MRMYKALLGAAAAALATSAHAAVLYQNDFDGNLAVHAGVTGGLTGVTTLTTATTGAWNADGWAGNVLRNDSQGDPAGFTTLSLANLATHTQISMSFIIGLLDSWDSDGGGGFGPDNLEIWIDGTQVATMTTNTALGSTEALAGGTKLYSGFQTENGSSYYSDVLVDMSGAPFMSFAHTASTFTLAIRASGAGWQGAGDEAWGIDNIAITYDGVRDTPPPGPGVPEPATWAMMIVGFGAAGAMLRRRRTIPA
ncbi:PEPxxWA-CTERM sorting domain-containing protein [Phenylobacterium sp.]|uniref:PEPxxWA-CTERM sorting domain-containing protein n=1 Tax=Phenylobacterium sp. TaxID=1871053 RepID=UPI0025EC5968|nr:PEPxxWA-CTERM sorting domain-containing protein [Phenylobacterium sp.]MBX3483692.1 PEPxxWA-CTERM sorting domain-containing protein [Phenylobacterium sp.]